MSSPLSIFGAPLIGDNLVRFIYVDEAGVDAKEEVTVVVGLIVDADRLLLAADSAIANIMQDVPDAYKPLTFHATDIWSNRKLRENWTKDERKGLLCRMMSFPRNFGIPIAISMVRRSSPAIEPPTKFQKSQEDHIKALAHCIVRADEYMRLHAGKNEIASVVAEDLDKIKNTLRLLPEAIKEFPAIIPEAVHPNIGATIRFPIHFVRKDVEPLTQVADACAFGFKYYFTKQPEGVEFIESILGIEPDPLILEKPSHHGMYFHMDCEI